MQVPRQSTAYWFVSKYGDFYHAHDGSFTPRLFTTMVESLEAVRKHLQFQVRNYMRDCPGLHRAKRHLAEVEAALKMEGTQ